VSESVGSIGGVVVLDDGVGGLEEIESEVVLLDGSVRETVVGDVLHE